MGSTARDVFVSDVAVVCFTMFHSSRISDIGINVSRLGVKLQLKTLGS